MRARTGQSCRWTLLPLLAVVAATAQAQGQEPTPGMRVIPASRFDIDAILQRPYGPEVPFGGVGERLWASSPQGWAFRDDVHWVYLTNIQALDLEIRDEFGLLQPAKATYFPSHVHLEGTERAVTASASFTFRLDRVENPLTPPFKPEKRWTAWSSGTREDWYAVDFGAPRTLQGVKVFFFDDTGTGGCRPPEQFQVEGWSDGKWVALRTISRQPDAPEPGENVVRFEPVATEKLRLVFRHAGDRFYTGLYGFEPIAAKAKDGARAAESKTPLEITADKFLTRDDILMTIVKVRNPTDQPRTIEVMPVLDWQEQYEAQVVSNRVAGKPGVYGPWIFRAEWRTRYHGFDVRQSLRFTATSEPPVDLDVFDSHRATVAISHGRDDNASWMREAIGFQYTVAPGETKVFKAALEFKRPEEPSTLDRVLAPPTQFERGGAAETGKLGIIPAKEQDVRDVLAEQVQAYQDWFQKNLATFDCSDDWVTKMYYHRAYNLRKNMMDPKLGALKWPTQSEGRWRSTWYPNVISYGAAHQIREARWLRDPKYWQGHLRTWVENQKPDHVYPSHVLPSGPAGGQYTDWITASAWDGQLVHPDKAFLAQIVDKLADNVRGWQSVSDPDGDGLLRVDSHWWTGMEYQPSFFFFSDFKTSNDFSQPETKVSLERVDLTAYNFGNAVAVARIYRLLGQPEKAKEFDELASKIARAVGEKMWRPETKFFYSLRADDDTVADVKEIIGVYPFYFGMFEPGKGFEEAWASILDPEQFWTPWPVASVSRQCPAYSQSGWPQANGRASTCMWNGPTWPHANAIVLTAMARTLRADRNLEKPASPLTREKLWELFHSFTKAQYRDQDLEYPWTGEFYNGETAQWKTAERDYNHSTWLDILIPEILGLVPRDDDILEIDPLVPEGTLTRFLLDGQRYRGHDVTLVWDAPGDEIPDAYADGRKGLDVYLDGRMVSSTKSLSRIQINMKTRQPISGAKSEPRK